MPDTGRRATPDWCPVLDDFGVTCARPTPCADHPASGRKQTRSVVVPGAGSVTASTYGPGRETTHGDDCHRREGGTYCDCGAAGRRATPITLPCGCQVVIGRSDYEALCEPHRLAQQQDAAAPPARNPSPSPSE